jgi:hypothetical protein
MSHDPRTGDRRDALHAMGSVVGPGWYPGRAVHVHFKVWTRPR